jgi:alkylation response protein AidB-like acyl-CoA dehydrogenase
MDFQLSAEQELMRDSTRRLVERVITPELLSHAPDQPLPKSSYLNIFKGLADIGLTAPRLPESAGGPGIRMIDYGVMFEQIPAVTGIALIAHEGAVARLYGECNDAQRERFLPDLIAGNKIGCTGATEPDAGSDPRGIQTRLTRQDGKLLLNGSKMWITNATVADTLVVTCRDCRENADGRAVIKVVVEREHAAFTTRNIDTIGLQQGILGEVTFSDCEIPPGNVIDSPVGGTEILKKTWMLNRPLIGLLAVHMAEQALDKAIDYVRQRKQFGKVIAAHQLVQKNLVDCVASITAARALCHQALVKIDRGEAAEGAAAMAKRFAQNTCRDAVWQAMNAHGAMGLSREVGIEKLYRDICMLPIPDGTNEILTLIQGRELTGVEALRGIVPTHA